VTFSPPANPGTTYRIVVENPHGVNRGVVRVELDGVALEGATVPIAHDAASHVIRVVLGESAVPVSVRDGDERMTHDSTGASSAL
jgi:hypothetical protein